MHAIELRRWVWACALVAALPALARADAPAAPPPAPAGLEVAGALPQTGTITLADLKKLQPSKASWTNHGEAHEVTGVPLDRVLVKFGFDPGSMGKDVPKREKRRGWHKVVVASARDGFSAVLSCAEVFETMGATRALVVWEMDGKPLPPDRGPLRLVVLTDKEPSRSVFSLARLNVVDLSSTVP
jgi:DMSO/TMAO reductase YedYZ molybdopterin-dependent catalytic subunit